MIYSKSSVLFSSGFACRRLCRANRTASALTHLRSRNSDARLDNMVNGIGAEMLGRALTIGMEFADGKVAQAA